MSLSPETRAQKIASYGAAYQTLVDGLKAFPAEMWDFRDECGCWSVREHLVHIADSEAHIPEHLQYMRENYDAWRADS